MHEALLVKALVVMLPAQNLNCSSGKAKQRRQQWRRGNLNLSCGCHYWITRLIEEEIESPNLVSMLLARSQLIFLIRILTCLPQSNKNLLCQGKRGKGKKKKQIVGFTTKKGKKIGFEPCDPFEDGQWTTPLESSINDPCDFHSTFHLFSTSNGSYSPIALFPQKDRNPKPYKFIASSENSKTLSNQIIHLPPFPSLIISLSNPLSHHQISSNVKRSQQLINVRLRRSVSKDNNFPHPTPYVF